jgi:DNA modification methylase
MPDHQALLFAHSNGLPPFGVSLERFPTNTTTSKHAIHRWFNFTAGFSPEFVQTCVTLHRQNIDGIRLLDPFAGCGTTLVAGKMMGLETVGYDPHPFLFIIAKAKANSDIYRASIPQIWLSILRGLDHPQKPSQMLSESACAFLSKLIIQENFEALMGARCTLEEDGFIDNPLAILVLSKMLDYCCSAATDGIYKAPTTKKRALSPIEALKRIASIIEEDCKSKLTETIRSTLYCESSEQMSGTETNSIDIVVTSPPYLNNFDFAEMTRMYLYFWGMANSAEDITDNVRSKLIVNTTTALKGHRDRQDIYKKTLAPFMQQELDVIVDLLNVKRKSKSGKKQYNLLVYPYFSQMQQVLKDCLRVMKPGATFHMMIADAALYGVHVHIPRWIADIMVWLGFKDVECHIVRSRGSRWLLDKREGAETGLGEYYIFARAS